MGIHDGIRPECGSEDIRLQTGITFNFVRAIWQLPTITVYVCADCGYIAQFIEVKHRSHIAKKWKSLHESKRKNDD